MEPEAYRRSQFSALLLLAPGTKTAQDPHTGGRSVPLRDLVWCGFARSGAGAACEVGAGATPNGSLEDTK